MKELVELIQDTQKYLNGSSKGETHTNIEFLNQLSLKFSKIFDHLRKFLIFDVMVEDNKTTVIEQSFLCVNQIVICLKFLEKTVQREAIVGCLITSRQCFSERILWCLARLKSTVKSANDNVMQTSDPENFISLLDFILDELAPFSALGNTGEDVKNRAEHRAELMMKSKEIRGLVERLLSHAMTFANIAIESDKNPLKALSQNIFRAAVEFEEEMSLKPGKKEDQNHQKVRAIALENSLLSLENFVNDALLRLVYEVFQFEDGKVIGKLRNIKDPAELDQEIAKFDVFVERLIQIGHFAIWFSRDDQKISSALRSCVASIENLDVYLIPALSKDPSIEILQEHFEGELRSMQCHVQQIVDTQAFCGSLTEQINAVVKDSQRKFDSDSLKSITSRAHVLLNHFHVNAKSLEISQDKVAKFYLGDFKLILSECEAILSFSDIENFEARTIKRFKILSSTVGKLEKAIQRREKMKDAKENPVEAEEFPSKCSEYFNSIRPSGLGSILYESKRSMKFNKNDSNFLSGVARKSSKKRTSFRMAIFKKVCEFENEEAWNKEDTNQNLTLDLQITQILDKITDLSTTLSMKSK